jgi:Ca-activated chloride channel family protein
MSRSLTALAPFLIPSVLALTPALLFAPTTAAAATEQAKAQSLIQDAAGELMLRDRAGNSSQQAVRLGTDMKVTISGPLARITVTQAFLNTSRQWVEATYLFPMPEDSAVDSLKMVVGDRIIIGEIQPREEARATYEKAREEGKTASLMEQQRPNMFTTKVANVGPGETVLISIEYQVAIEQSADHYRLRLPLVVAPRYVPPGTVLVQGPQGLQAIPQAMADAQAVTAPIIPPNDTAKPAPLSITVHLTPGFAVADLNSPSHAVTIGDSDDKTGAVIRLRDSEGAGNRDFELSWGAAEKTATSALFQETWKGEHYVMAVVTPPTPDFLPPPPARELVFVIDNSGSMGGESMDQAKESLVLALRSLTTKDTFNVIRFDDTLTLLFPKPVQATAKNIAFALGFTNGLTAQGGTEMVPALQAALVDSTPDDHRLRQVVFLTDGAISNEGQMLSILDQSQGRSRVFMVGIGSAPNGFLMSRMAELGRGSYVPIPKINLVQDRMADLLNRLTRPAVTDLRLITTSGTLDLTPTPVASLRSAAPLGTVAQSHILPDLYAGQPLVVMGSTHQLTGKMIIQGRIGDTPWTQTLDLDHATDAPGVAKQWARRRITDIELKSTLGELETTDAEMAITAAGLTYELVTSQTSLVAVDHTPRRPAGARLSEEELPLPLPQGWDFNALFGEYGPNSTTVPPSEASNSEMMELPQTGTVSTLLQSSGLALVLSGLLGLWLNRRRVQNRGQRSL